MKNLSKILIFALVLFILGVIGCIVVKNSNVNTNRELRLLNKNDTIK